MKKHEARFAQLFAVLAMVLSLFGVAQWLLKSDAPRTFDAAFDALGWTLAVVLILAPLGALIVTRRPGNKIGWLLLIGAAGAANPVTFLLPTTSPAEITPSLLLALWFDGWSWIPPIFALFLIPLYFPDGKLPTPRWKWLPWLALGMWLVFATLTLFASDVGPINENWQPLPNPIGFAPQSWFERSFMVVWFAGLLTLLGGSVFSLYGRYRRAGSVERQQIKWLLLAGVQFVVVYSLIFFSSNDEESASWSNVLFLPSALAIPIAVAMAILRYRLYDIDVIIRKTVQYGVVTAVLALTYFGTVILLQTLVGRTVDEQSPLIIVLSTLLIAALFSPLRRRVQNVIDRRFYRKKYDAQQVLAQFAQTARDETDMDKLTAALLAVVEETMQPERVTLWVKKE